MLQTKGGKKIRRNQPLSGPITIDFGSGKDGLKLKICFAITDAGLKHVSGQFDGGQLHGHVKIVFRNDTEIHGQMEKGRLVGPYRQFDRHNKDLKLEGIFSGSRRIWSNEKNLKQGLIYLDLGGGKVYVAKSYSTNGYLCSERGHSHNILFSCKEVIGEIKVDPDSLDLKECLGNFKTDDTSQSFSFNAAINRTTPTGQNDRAYCLSGIKEWNEKVLT